MSKDWMLYWELRNAYRRRVQTFEPEVHQHYKELLTQCQQRWDLTAAQVRRLAHGEATYAEILLRIDPKFRLARALLNIQVTLK